MADIPGEYACESCQGRGLTGLGASAQLDAPLPEERL